MFCTIILHNQSRRSVSLYVLAAFDRTTHRQTTMSHYITSTYHYVTLHNMCRVNGSCRTGNSRGTISTAKTDDQNNVISSPPLYDIPTDCAETISQQTDLTSLPVYINHNSAYVIGHITGFSIQSVHVNDVPMRMLKTSFLITNHAFIEALRRVVILQYTNLDIPIYSSDAFITTLPRIPPTGTIDRTDLIRALVNTRLVPDTRVSDIAVQPTHTTDLTAQVVLCHQYSGVSLVHNNADYRVTELSICIAGARLCSTIESALLISTDARTDTDA